MLRERAPTSLSRQKNSMSETDKQLHEITHSFGRSTTCFMLPIYSGSGTLKSYYAGNKLQKQVIQQCHDTDVTAINI